MEKVLFLTSFVLSIFLASCATVTYKYKGVAYDSADKAIATHKLDMDLYY